MTEYTVITDLPTWLLRAVNWLLATLAQKSGRFYMGTEKPGSE